MLVHTWKQNLLKYKAKKYKERKGSSGYWESYTKT